MEINTLKSEHKLFQQRLNQLADPPKTLYYKGDLSFPNKPLVAIVGTRKPTSYGQEMTYQLAYSLAREGCVVISGLALGVDGIAHQAALDAGGRTIAVMAGGLDSVYPRRHERLAGQILRTGGALVSEYTAGAPCLPHQFVARNRIIAALSDGLLVAEAAAKSGSLHTAEFALDLGRATMALPGLATNPMAGGSLNLLKSGALLVTTVDDIYFAVDYAQDKKGAQTSLLGSTSEESILLHLLASGAQSGELLFKKSNLDVATFQQTLTMLEITGKIRALGGNQWMLI